MANIFKEDNRAKLRRIWCIVLKCVIELPCILSECLGHNITMSTNPPGTISILHGEPLEIFCVGKSYTSDDLEFTINGEYVHSVRVNDTTRRLYIENPEKQLSAYSCRNKKTDRICINLVLVESPPLNVIDFNCVSRNLEKVNCSWSYPVTKTDVNYTLTFIVDGSRAEPCVGKNEENFERRTIANCIWDVTSHPRYRQMEPTLNFYLIACNIFGCNNQIFTIDHYSIVKPDPPVYLRVVKIGAHSVNLKWSIPFKMFDVFPYGVEHIIEYRIAKIDNTTFFHKVDASTLHSNDITYKFQLSNLPFAHMQYEVRIYIKSKKAVNRKYWSDFSNVVFYTASERPQRPPDMVTGAFDQGFFAENRIVYVYWKQLEKYEEAGENFTYKVQVTQGLKVNTMYPDASTSLSYIILKDVSLEALYVTAWSVNDIGPSTNSSHLYIPAYEDTQSLRVTSFIKLAHENSTYELYWFGAQNVDNYTLFWCQDEHAKICSGRMNFTVLAASENRHVIDLPREHGYQFAISANSGAKSSGMVWATSWVVSKRFGMYEQGRP